MRKYARYKDSGISWIGEVPEHWDVVRNKNFIDEKDEVVGEKFRDYTLLSLTKGGVIARDVESGKGKFPKDFESYKIVQPGNVIFCLFDVDETPRTVGLSSLRGMITGAYDVFEPININARYYAYYFLAVDDRKALRPLYTGLRKVVKKDRFLACKIPVPPLPEQKAIAEYLDKKTAQINELVSAKQKQIELLKEYKQSVIANAVTGKLDEINDTRRFSTLVELSSMRRTGSRPTDKRREKINWIGYLPRHWQKRKFQYLFKERSEKNHPEEPVLCATQSRGVIPQSMYENRVVVVNTGFEGLKFVKKGDFVITLRSFQGGIEYAYYQGIISAAYTILYINTKDLYSDYVRLLFKSVPFIGLLQTCVTGIREGQNINNDLLRKQIIPVPPLSEQKEIVAYIEKKVSSIDSQIASIENQIANLNEYKQSLISDVVTGKVKVC